MKWPNYQIKNGFKVAIFLFSFTGQIDAFKLTTASNEPTLTADLVALLVFSFEHDLLTKKLEIVA